MKSGASVRKHRGGRTAVVLFQCFFPTGNDPFNQPEKGIVIGSGRRASLTGNQIPIVPAELIDQIPPCGAGGCGHLNTTAQDAVEDVIRGVPHSQRLLKPLHHRDAGMPGSGVPGPGHTRSGLSPGS